LIILYAVLAASVDEFGLTISDHNKIKRGELINKERKIKGSPWPEISVFASIDATAKESCSVFYAYHEHKDFLPDLLSSVPVKYLSPTELILKFEMRIPWPLKNSKYISGNKLAVYGEGGYKIEWYHVVSNSSKDSHGMVIFLPYNKRTLFIYKSFVNPKSILAGLFRKRVLKEVLRSAKAIISRIESIKKNKKGKLREYIMSLNKSLNGKYIYQNIPREEK